MPSYDAYEMIPVIDKLLADGTLKLPNRCAIHSSKTIMDGLAKNFAAVGWKVTSTDLLRWVQINDWRAFLQRVGKYRRHQLSARKRYFMTLEQPTNSLVFIQYAPSV